VERERLTASFLRTILAKPPAVRGGFAAVGEEGVSKMPVNWRLQRRTLSLRRVRSRRADGAAADHRRGLAIPNGARMRRPHRMSAKADCVPL